MAKKLPILIIVPHGGVKKPEELSEQSIVSDFELFMSSDSCANDIFSFNDNVSATLNTDISKLFIDLNRSPYALTENSEDGVIKRKTPYGKDIYPPDTFPNAIAITNILKRYHFSFHETLEKILKSGEIKLVIECHTTMPVGPKNAPDADKPRPIASIDMLIEKGFKLIETCPPTLSRFLIEELEKNFLYEDAAVDQPFRINLNPSKGYILNNYLSLVPILRLNISRGLFINNQYFNDHYLKVDQIRLNHIKKRIWSAISKSFSKFYK